MGLCDDPSTALVVAEEEGGEEYVQAAAPTVSRPEDEQLSDDDDEDIASYLLSEKEAEQRWAGGWGLDDAVCWVYFSQLCGIGWCLHAVSSTCRR